MSKFDHRYVSSFFTSFSLKDTDKAYIDFHKYRFAFVLNQIHQLQEKDSIISLLDIGPSFLTNLVAGTFEDLKINTLGLNNDLVQKKYQIEHILQDLNFLEKSQNLPSAKYDLILFAEVIEHLFTDPHLVLKGIRKLLRPGGYLLLQTPNAVSIDKRLKMLLGSNPYQQIIPNRQNHFREYTVRELIRYLVASGFEVKQCIRSNYFNPASTIYHRWFRILGPVLPAGWRDGISIICRKK